MLHKMGIGGEVVLLAMLEDEDAIVFQEPLLKDETGNRGKLFQGVRGIGKDKIKLLLTGFDEAEHVTTNWQNLRRISEFLQAILDETVVITIQFDADHLAAATREEFEADAACT